MMLARDKAKQALKAQKQGSQTPTFLYESGARAVELNRPDLVLLALLDGEMVSFQGAPARMTTGYELFTGADKITLDGKMETAWYPVKLSLQEFIFRCAGMSDKEAVEAAAATCF